MQYTLVFLIATLLNSLASAQCPIQLQEASLDGKGENLTIQYYNSSTRVAKDMHFRLLSEDPVLISQPIVRSFSISGTVHPKQKRTANFDVSGIFLSGALALEVKQVRFADGGNWFAHANDSCKITLTQH